jgi:hypothetical protein
MTIIFCDCPIYCGLSSGRLFLLLLKLLLEPSIVEVSNEEPNLEKSDYTSNLREAIIKTIGVSFVGGSVFRYKNFESDTIFVHNYPEMSRIALSMKPGMLDCRSLK